MVRSLLLLLAVLIAATPKPITLTVKPEQSFAPAHVILTVHIKRTPDNRTLGWACDSGDFYRSSVFTLDGENSPATFIEDKVLRDVPEGDYTCIAELTYANGSSDKATAIFHAIGHEQ